MKTVRIKVYSFNELSEEAKSKAVEKLADINNCVISFNYNDAHETIKKFNELFNLKEGNHSFLEYYDGYIDDDILNLCNEPLNEYINSKIDIDKYQDCLLTGHCYDISMLFNLKHADKNTTLKECFDNCFASIKKTLQDEEDYLQSREAIEETILANDYQFLIDGTMFN